MPIPDREQQILQSHAAFICEAVACLQNADGRARLDELLRAARDNGWAALAGALLDAVGNSDKATEEGWRKRGAAFFQGKGRKASSGLRQQPEGTLPTGGGAASA